MEDVYVEFRKRIKGNIKVRVRVKDNQNIQYKDYTKNFVKTFIIQLFNPRAL